MDIRLLCAISQQEYWSGLPFPSPGDLPDPGIKPMSPEVVGELLYHQEAPQNIMNCLKKKKTNLHGKTPWSFKKFKKNIQSNGQKIA